MALYSMAIRSHDDKRLTCPYLQASQVSMLTEIDDAIAFSELMIDD